MQPGRLAVFLEGSEAFTPSIESARAFCSNSKTEASHLASGRCRMLLAFAMMANWGTAHQGQIFWLSHIGYWRELRLLGHCQT